MSLFCRCRRGAEELWFGVVVVLISLYCCRCGIYNTLLSLSFCGRGAEELSVGVIVVLMSLYCCRCGIYVALLTLWCWYSCYVGVVVVIVLLYCCRRSAGVAVLLVLSQSKDLFIFHWVGCIPVFCCVLMWRGFWTFFLFLNFSCFFVLFCYFVWLVVHYIVHSLNTLSQLWNKLTQRYYMS